MKFYLEKFYIVIKYFITKTQLRDSKLVLDKINDLFRQATNFGELKENSLKSLVSYVYEIGNTLQTCTALQGDSRKGKIEEKQPLIQNSANPLPLLLRTLDENRETQKHIVKIYFEQAWNIITRLIDNESSIIFVLKEITSLIQQVHATIGGKRQSCCMPFFTKQSLSGRLFYKYLKKIRADLQRQVSCIDTVRKSHQQIMRTYQESVRSQMEEIRETIAYRINSVVHHTALKDDQNLQQAATLQQQLDILLKNHYEFYIEIIREIKNIAWQQTKKINEGYYFCRSISVAEELPDFSSRPDDKLPIFVIKIDPVSEEVRELYIYGENPITKTLGYTQLELDTLTHAMIPTIGREVILERHHISLTLRALVIERGGPSFNDASHLPNLKQLAMIETCHKTWTIADYLQLKQNIMDDYYYQSEIICAQLRAAKNIQEKITILERTIPEFYRIMIDQANELDLATALSCPMPLFQLEIPGVNTTTRQDAATSGSVTTEQSQTSAPPLTYPRYGMM